MTEQDTEGLKDQIKQRIEDWKYAFVSKDIDAMMSFYADGQDFSAFDMMAPLEFRGGDMWRRNWIDFLGAWEGSPQMKFSGVEIHVSGELAIFRAMVNLSGTMAGQPADMWSRQTNCFRLIDDEWLMIHDHVSVPMDFETGRALLDLKPPTGG